jgi:hypothetical protein
MAQEDGATGACPAPEGVELEHAANCEACRLALVARAVAEAPETQEEAALLDQLATPPGGRPRLRGEQGRSRRAQRSPIAR